MSGNCFCLRVTPPSSGNLRGKLASASAVNCQMNLMLLQETEGQNPSLCTISGESKLRFSTMAGGVYSSRRRSRKSGSENETDNILM